MRCATSESATRPALAAALAALAALGSTGCLVGPDFTRPAPPSSSSYLPAVESTPAAAADDAQRIALGSEIPAAWWTLFHSPRLDETLRQAIAANDSLAAARASLAQAREGVVEARAALYPQIDLSAGARRSGVSGATSTLFSVGPSVSYSVDAFGGTRRRVEQAAALAETERYQLAAAYLTLTGDAVAEAVTIASTRFQISTLEDLIQNDQKNLDLTKRSFDAGRVARSDVLTAAAQLESDRTQLPALDQALSVARHALSVLASRSPAEWSPPDFDLDELALPNDLPVRVPSELVRRRPDILAAEALLHADSAAIGVATAEIYPSIVLSSSLVQDAVTVASLFRAASRTWEVGAGADAPVFRGGALAAQRRAAIDAYEGSLATYRQTVVEAFGQVANVLTAIVHDGETVAASQRAVDIAEQSLALQRSSYAAGKTSALQLIVAENTYSSARLGYVRALGQRLSDTVQLFVAVGGGWWNDDAAAPESGKKASRDEGRSR